MGVPVLTVAEARAMGRAGAVAAATLAHVGARIRAGITTADIERWVRHDTRARGAAPSQLGYKGFPAAVCTSRNQVVCHGIPSPRERLEPGDIINVDVTSHIGGFHGDTSATFFVGTPSPEARHVVETAERCRDLGVATVREGVRLGEVGAAIERLARAEGCSVVRELGGHGIGRKMHQEPHVPHHGGAGNGRRLRAGMAITIEPMINLGGPAVHFLDDGWTVVTADGQLSAQFEHTVIVTRNGCEMTTRAAGAQGSVAFATSPR
jgi:methionyl aminopeptidase